MGRRAIVPLNNPDVPGWRLVRHVWHYVDDIGALCGFTYWKDPLRLGSLRHPFRSGDRLTENDRNRGRVCPACQAVLAYRYRRLTADTPPP